MSISTVTVKVRKADADIIKKDLIPAICSKYPELASENFSYQKAINILLRAWKGELKL